MNRRVLNFCLPLRHFGESLSIPMCSVTTLIRSRLRRRVTLLNHILDNLDTMSAWVLETGFRLLLFCLSIFHFQLFAPLRHFGYCLSIMFSTFLAFNFPLPHRGLPPFWTSWTLLCRTIPPLRDHVSHEDAKTQRNHFLRFKHHTPTLWSIVEHNVFVFSIFNFQLFIPILDILDTLVQSHLTKPFTILSILDNHSELLDSR